MLGDPPAVDPVVRLGVVPQETKTRRVVDGSALRPTSPVRNVAQQGAGRDAELPVSGVANEPEVSAVVDRSADLIIDEHGNILADYS